MSSYVGSVPIGAVIVFILFGSAMITMITARLLPEHHLSAEARTTVSVSVAIVGTMSAMVVGLFVSMANGSYTGKSAEVTNISIDTINLDQTLRRYGPPAQGLRQMLRHYTAQEVQDFFPRDRHMPAQLQNGASLAMLEQLQDGILALPPGNATQTWLKNQALTLSGNLLTARLRLAQEELSRPPLPMFVLVMFWFVVIFASFGLFAPRNGTVIIAIFLSAMSIGSAIRMTTELQRPFEGVVRLSSAPLVQALDMLNR